MNMQRQAPLEPKNVEVTQVEHIDKFVDVPVAMCSQVRANSNRAESTGRATCSIP